MTPLHPDYQAAIPVASAVARASLLRSAMYLSLCPANARVPEYVQRTTDTVRDFAQYDAYGLSLVIWDSGGDPDKRKSPHVKDWPEKHFPLDGYRPGNQVGVKTGCEIASGKVLAAVDYDWLPGLQFVKAFFPDTGFATFRPSKPLSQTFYTVEAPQPTRRYKDIDGADGTTLVEFRCATVDGKSGHQSLVAPSPHKSGEHVRVMHDSSGIVHCPDLARRVRNYAIACLLARHLPLLGLGFGHEVRLAFAGFALQSGLDPADVSVIANAVITWTGNRDQHDINDTIKTTLPKVKSGQRVAGKGALAKALGEDGKKVVARVADFVRGQTEGEGDVVMAGGHLHAIVNRAEAALLASPTTTIYQRGGCLIHPIRLDRAVGEGDNVRREAGSTMLLAVREPWLLEQMGLRLRWLRPKANGELVAADPDAIYARTLLGRGEWRFPVLRGVVTAPTLARDGRILQAPGFDVPSGLLLDFAANAFPPIAPTPTKDAASAALQQLQHPLRGFPFADDASKSVALAAMLTALVRPSLRTSPLHAFDAPTAGTGKSLLAELVGLLATGARPPALSQGKTAEEDEKRLSTVLFAGDPVIHVDNCERAVSGDFLCSMLTQEVVQARILGLSERRVLPSTSLVLASGNNLVLAGDASRRAVICRLDAGVERPDTRDFDFDCHAEVLAHRPELVVYGLTMLRAYVVAGFPERLTPMGSFADWEWIRGTLVWLGCVDPADTRQTVLDADPRRDELREVMDLWDAYYRDIPTEVSDIPKNAPADLQAALRDVACHGGVWSSKSVGWWLRRHKDRVVDGRCFRCESERKHQRWRLTTRDGLYTWPDGSRSARPEWVAEEHEG